MVPCFCCLLRFLRSRELSRHRAGHTIHDWWAMLRSGLSEMMPHIKFPGYMGLMPLGQECGAASHEQQRYTMRTAKTPVPLYWLLSLMDSPVSGHAVDLNNSQKSQAYMCVALVFNWPGMKPGIV